MQSGKRPYPMMQRTNEGPEGANLPTSTATNRVFHFESAEGVIAYIKQTPWFQQNDYKDVESIEPINQGSTNYIYRVILCGLASPTGSPNVQASAIVKHAPGNLLATPEIRFSSGRQIYEVAAMETIPRVLAPDALTLPVTIPTVIHYDPIASVIVMEDLNLTRLDAGKGTSSEQTMKLSQFCSDATAPSSMPLVRDVGNALGQFLYQLHSLTSLFEKSQNPALLDLRDLCAAHEDARRVAAELIFGDFLCLLDSNSVRLTEEERRVIEDIFTRETIYLTNTMETLVMGDFMVTNAMIRLNYALNSSTPNAMIYVLDWEFVTCAPAYIDLAHFAGEAWLYNYFGAPNIAWSELTSTLFKAYRKHGGSIDMQRVIYYIAGYIARSTQSFPSAKGHEKREMAARAAASMVIHASRKEWQTLKQDTFLEPLLETF